MRPEDVFPLRPLGAICQNCDQPIDPLDNCISVDPKAKFPDRILIHEVCPDA